MTTATVSTRDCGAIPDVSIVIVHWNTPELLSRCVQALEPALCGLVYETIVVDNGSTGQGRMSLASGGSLVVIANATNRGFAAAANQGASLARAELLLFLNTDVTLSAGSVARLASCLGRNRELAAVAAIAVPEDGPERRPGMNFLNPLNHACELLGYLGSRCLDRSRRGARVGDSANGAAVTVDWLRASTLLVRTRAFRSVCGFDEAYFFYEEDEDLCWRLGRRGYTVAESQDVRVGDPGGLSAARVRDWAIASLYSGQMRFVRRRGGATAVLGYRVAVSMALATKLLARGLQGHSAPPRSAEHRRHAITILRSLWQPSHKVSTFPA